MMGEPGWGVSHIAMVITGIKDIWVEGSPNNNNNNNNNELGRRKKIRRMGELGTLCKAWKVKNRQQ